MALPIVNVRKKRFTDHEKSVLINLLTKYSDIIENKRTDSITSLKKKRTWAKLTEEYNASPHVLQTATLKQLVKAWKNMKAKQRALQKSGFYPTLSENSISNDEEGDGTNNPCHEFEVDPLYSLPPETDNYGLWSYGKNNVKNCKDKNEIETPEDIECVFHDSKDLKARLGHQEQHHHIQGQQFYSHVGNVETTAMQPLTAHSGAQPDTFLEGDAASQDSVQQSLNSQRQFNYDESKSQRRCNEELHDLRMQLASAQVEKVKAETVLMKRLLNEQVRKAKAEADLAELLLERNRSS